MRRLEHEDEEKFWEAWIKDDTIFCFRFGKIGTTGQTRIKRHATREEAEADLEDNIQRKLKEAGHGRVRIEGQPQCDWVLIDARDIIVHVFRPEVREFYNLEKMWSAERPGEQVAH